MELQQAQTENIELKIQNEELLRRCQRYEQIINTNSEKNITDKSDSRTLGKSSSNSNPDVKNHI